MDKPAAAQPMAAPHLMLIDSFLYIIPSYFTKHNLGKSIRSVICSSLGQLARDAHRATKFTKRRGARALRLRSLMLEQKPGPHPDCASDFDISAFFQHEVILKAHVGLVRCLDLDYGAGSLHT